MLFNTNYLINQQRRVIFYKFLFETKTQKNKKLKTNSTVYETIHFDCLSLFNALEFLKKIYFHQISMRILFSFIRFTITSCRVSLKLAAAKIILKLLNFVQKQRRKDIAQEMFTKFNDDSDLLKKIRTVMNYGRMTMTLKQKPNQIKGSVQESEDRKKKTPSSIKFVGSVLAY